MGNLSRFVRLAISPDRYPFIIKEKSHVSLQNVLGILALVRTCHLFLEELDDVVQDFFRESHRAKQPRPIKFLP